MESQQYMLRCEDFYERIGASIQYLYGHDEFTDVTLACDGHLFKAHKMILSASSPYFRKILQDNPCQHPVILLQNIEQQVLKDLINYIYYGEVNISIGHLNSFLNIAKNLQIQGLAEIKNEASTQFIERKNDEERKKSLELIENLEEIVLKKKAPNIPLSPKIPQPEELEIEEITIEEPYYEKKNNEPFNLDTKRKAEPYNLDVKKRNEKHENALRVSVKTEPIRSELEEEEVTKREVSFTTTTQNKATTLSTYSMVKSILNRSQGESSGLGTNIACKVCGKIQKNEYQLKYHMYKFHGQNITIKTTPVNTIPGQFSCPFCTEKYHTKRDMNTHILIVHQNENYNDTKCSICNKEFSSISNRNQHVLRYHAKVLD